MKEYIQENKDRFFEELFSLLRIPSISAKKEHKEDMRRCAERLAVLLMERLVYTPATATRWSSARR